MARAGFSDAIDMHDESYRPDIDGLRGIAVLAVVAYHAYPKVFTGGFIGVDVFFVISGFLITRIIISDLDAGTFTFGGFYARRVRRIFPALIVVMAVSWIVGFWRLSIVEHHQLSTHILSGAGFVSNLVFWREFNYFSNSAETMPMLHLWSLGVEEQFYFIWPAVLYLCWKRSRRSMLPIGLITAVSFFFNVMIARRDPVSAFYSPATRLWEMSAGGLLAVAALDAAKPGLFSLGRGVLSALGFALILAGGLLLDKTFSYPGIGAAIPCAAAFTLIGCGADAWINRRVLSHPLLVGCGIISYPLYLWHWPLLSFLAIRWNEAPPAYMRLAAVVLSVILAWLTYRFIETPIRLSSRQPVAARRLITGMFGAMTLVAGAALASYSSWIDRGEGHGRFGNARWSLDDHYARLFREECNFATNEKLNRELASDCVTPRHKRAVFIWGDSFAQHHNAGLTDYFRGKEVSLLQIATSSCAPDISDWAATACDRANRKAIETIIAVRPQVVVLSQRAHYNQARLALLVERLRKLDTRVVLLGPSPRWESNLAGILSRHYVLADQLPMRSKIGLSREPWESEVELKKRYAGHPYVRYVSLIDPLCDQDSCQIRIGDQLPDDLITVDYGHLSERGSIYVARLVTGPVIEALMRDGKISDR